MTEHYMDVDGIVKEDEEWLSEYVKGEITLLKLYTLRKCKWNSYTQKWLLI